MASPRRATPEIVSRVEAELADAEAGLTVAIAAHDRACSEIAADLEVGEVSPGDAASVTSASADELARCEVLAARLRAALPVLKARLDEQAAATEAKAVEARAETLRKQCAAVDAVAKKLGMSLAQANAQAILLAEARAAYGDLSTAGAPGSVAPSLLLSRRDAPRDGTGQRLPVPGTGWKDEPAWLDNCEALVQMIAEGPRRPHEKLLAFEQNRLADVARQNEEVLAWASVRPIERYTQILSRTDLADEVLAEARLRLQAVVAAAAFHPDDAVPERAPESAPEPAEAAA